MQPNNLLSQFNQPVQFQNLSKQNDIFETLIKELNSKPYRPTEDLMGRLDKLEIKNKQLKREIKREQQQVKSHDMPQNSMAMIPPVYQMPPMSYPPYHQSEEDSPDEDPSRRDRKKNKKEEKRRHKKEK
jgi:hypothetical protein